MSLLLLSGGIPPLPIFQPGVRVMAEGDSIIAFGYRFATSGLALETQTDSEIAWADVLAGGGRFRHALWQDGTAQRGASGAVAGAEPEDILARLDGRIAAAVAGGTQIMIVCAGTNGAVDKPASTHIAALDEILRRLRYAGIFCVLGTVRPRSIVADPLNGYEATDARWTRMYALNTWIRAQSRRPGVIVWDPWDDLRNPSATTQVGEALGNTLVDDVHPNARGAFLGAKSLAETLNRIIAPGSWLPDVAAGNAWPNPTMTGSGALSATGATGVIATGWSCSRATGSTAAVIGSKNGDGNQVLTFSSGVAAATTDVFYLIHTPTSALSAVLAGEAGSYWQLAFELDVSAWDGFAYVSPWIYESGGGVNNKTLSTTAPQYGGVYEGYNGIIALTPPIKRAAWTSIRARLAVGVYVGPHPVTGEQVTGTGTVTVKRAWLCQTENPETAFPL